MMKNYAIAVQIYVTDAWLAIRINLAHKIVTFQYAFHGELGNVMVKSLILAQHKAQIHLAL